jgi:hypothetical protein
MRCLVRCDRPLLDIWSRDTVLVRCIGVVKLLQLLSLRPFPKSARGALSRDSHGCDLSRGSGYRYVVTMLNKCEVGIRRPAETSPLLDFIKGQRAHLEFRGWDTGPSGSPLPKVFSRMGASGFSFPSSVSSGRQSSLPLRVASASNARKHDRIPLELCDGICRARSLSLAGTRHKRLYSPLA